MRSLVDEVPFDIPDSWEWVRVRNCTELFNGRAFKPSDWTVMGLPIVRIQNLNDEKAPFNYYDKSVEEDVHLYGGEFLFAWSGTSGTSFGAHIWRNQEAVLNQHIFKLLFDETALFKPYYMYALNQRVAHGSAGLQHVTRGVFESTLIPLPPFAEQIRIVEKLNVLFPIVDHYSSAYNNLNNLQSAFPEALKKSILQEAVQGKLVPQDPSDEPAEALLKRIRAEKQRLIKEGKIKKDKHESVIFRRDNSHYEKRGSEEVCIDEYLPFELPNNWQWERLINLYNFIDYRGSTPTKIDTGVPLITAKNVKKGYIDYKIRDYISEEEYCTRQSRGISQRGDILFTTEAPLGNVALADLDQFSAGQRLITLQQYTTYPLINNNLVMYFMLSDCFQSQLIEQSTGTTVKGIKADKLKQLWIPVPPLQEQVRILAQLRKVLEACIAL